MLSSKVQLSITKQFQDHFSIEDIKDEVSHTHRKTLPGHEDNDVSSFINLGSSPCGHLADLKMGRYNHPAWKLSISLQYFA